MTSPAATSAQPDSSSPAQTYGFSFSGRGGSFVLIFLKNVLLSLLTLGIYFAWGKTERRQYVWNNLTFHGEPFRYTGTGWELFKGYLVVAAAYAVLIGLSALMSQLSPTAEIVFQLAFVVGIFVAAPFLIYRSRAFLYNRTLWRAIRFGLERKGATQYAKTFLLGIPLSLLTLGLASPVVNNRLHRILIDNSSFGSMPFRYTAPDREVFWLSIKGLILTILTLGIYGFWFQADLLRLRLRHTHIGEHAVLRSELTGVDLLKLFLLQVFGTTLTLGLAFPWITMYAIRVVADRTFVDGFIDFEAIEQRAHEEGAASEGFADALDLDLGL